MANFHKFWGVKMDSDHDFCYVQVHDDIYEGFLTLAQKGTVNWRMVIYPTIKDPRCGNAVRLCKLLH